MICLVLKSKCDCDNDCLAPDYIPTIIVAWVNPEGDQDLAERVIKLIGESLDQPMVTVQSHIRDATIAGIEIMDILTEFPKEKLNKGVSFDEVKEVDPEVEFKA